MSSWQDNLKKTMGMGTLHADFYKDNSLVESFIFRNDKIFSHDNFSGKFIEIGVIAKNYTTISKFSLSYDSYNIIPPSRTMFFDFLNYWNKRSNLEIKLNNKPYGV